MARPGPFRRRLAELAPPETDRRWLYVPYDQLTADLGPLAHEDPDELGIVLIESTAKATRRPYHRQKLALVLANLRWFALEQAARGVAVRHVATDAPYAVALREAAAELGPLRVMQPAERELRCELAPLVTDGLLEIVPHEGWLTTREQFVTAAGDRPPWRMDTFYRHVRRETGILMDEDGKPLGGKLSHDAANRKPWKGEPPAPTPPTFEVDDVTAEVGDLIERRFARHPGRLDLEHLPTTAADAATLWTWAREQCLAHFGPYEDAMSTRSTGLFHTRISPLLNLHRLLPRQILDDMLALDLPLASKEGFVRQLIGWREFVHHVHVETDGFREIASRTVSVGESPGDGGWSKWTGEPWRSDDGERVVDAADGGARPNQLLARRDLPPAFWGEPSGLACLDQVVADVWNEGWSHHITRLMILSNLATLLGVEPRQLTDWFWVAYVDAYDWVVEPNVLGMGTYAVGDLMTTKPYVSGAAYIDRMSDYCAGCRFDPRKTCPIDPNPFLRPISVRAARSGFRSEVSGA